MDQYSPKEASIIKEIEALPKGNISYKKIRGKRRMYLQWTEDGERRSQYVRADDEQVVISQIERRKELENQLRSMRLRAESEPYSMPASMQGALWTAEEADNYVASNLKGGADIWSTSVTTGRLLRSMISAAASFGKRDCFSALEHYLSSRDSGRVCVIYGLRRTGKTTMLFQAMCGLPLTETAYIKIKSRDTMEALNRDLLTLSSRGYRYVFIDEATLLSDFIDSASLLSDIYAQAGMKIVLSGTDSLGFALSAENELYDRAVMIHTTLIPFREYSRLLGIKDIDEYIRYGGTLRAAETDFESSLQPANTRSFEDDESARRYIDTAVAHNIQHSLINYEKGGHFRHLTTLHEANELTNAVNRIIEDMNHQFLLSALTRDWDSHDLGSTRQIMRKEAAGRKEISPLDLINTKETVERVKKILEIRNKYECSVELTDDHVREIREYLRMLDLIKDCPMDVIGSTTPTEHVIITQPGMRFCQAQALVHSVMKDPYFTTLSPTERKEVTNKILEDVRGRMLEDIVLLETSMALSRGMRAFKLSFSAGEIDMVIYDSEGLTCRLYEVKHSNVRDPKQYRHLIDKEKNRLIEQQYGEIISRTVIYRGETALVEDGDYTIEYTNVEDYLNSINP